MKAQLASQLKAAQGELTEMKASVQAVPELQAANADLTKQLENTKEVIQTLETSAAEATEAIQVHETKAAEAAKQAEVPNAPLYCVRLSNVSVLIVYVAAAAPKSPHVDVAEFK